MDTITRRYEDILKKLFVMFQNSANSQDRKSLQKQKQRLRDLFMKQGMQMIQKANNKLKIIMDNQYSKAIQNQIKITQKTYLCDFKTLEQNINYLNLMSQIVHEQKFITRRQYIKIETEIKRIKDSKNYKFNNRLNVLAKSSNKEELRDQLLFYMFGEDTTEDQEQVWELYRKFYRFAMDNLERRLFIKLDSIISKIQNRQEILDPELLAKVDEYFGQEIGKNDIQLNLNMQLMQRAQEQSLLSNQEKILQMDEHYQEIKKILNKFSAMKLINENLKIQLHLCKFGSIISGFATRNTDMDLTLLTNCYINQLELLKCLEQFIRAQFKEKKNKENQVKLISTARIPLLKITHTTNKGKADIDLIVNNILGVINSKFLSVYGSIQWIRHLGVLIKLWAKNKALIEEQKFSSYSFNLMLLHFLIETRRINLIMDARERNPDKSPFFEYRRKSKQEDQTFKVYFDFKTQQKDVTNLKRINIIEVLTQFFEYYSEGGKHWKFRKQESIITVDGSKAKDFQDSFIFTIKDPFDQKHNPGRIQAPYKQEVMRKFNQTFETLKRLNQKPILELFN